MAPQAPGSKKKLAQFAKRGTRTAGHRPCYADLFDAQQVIREGHDFSSQQELANANNGVQSADPMVIRLIQEALRDLEMLERTGQLPCGLSYSDLPAYKVALYRAYWQHNA